MIDGILGILVLFVIFSLLAVAIQFWQITIVIVILCASAILVLRIEKNEKKRKEKEEYEKAKQERERHAQEQHNKSLERLISLWRKGDKGFIEEIESKGRVTLGDRNLLISLAEYSETPLEILEYLSAFDVRFFYPDYDVSLGTEEEYSISYNQVHNTQKAYIEKIRSTARIGLQTKVDRSI